MSDSFKPLKTIILAVTVTAIVMGAIYQSIGFAVLFWIIMIPVLMLIAVPMSLGNHLSAPHGDRPVTHPMPGPPHPRPAHPVDTAKEN